MTGPYPGSRKNCSLPAEVKHCWIEGRVGYGKTMNVQHAAERYWRRLGVPEGGEAGVMADDFIPVTVIKLDGSHR